MCLYTYVEQLTRNEQVSGSSPLVGSLLYGICRNNVWSRREFLEAESRRRWDSLVQALDVVDGSLWVMSGSVRLRRALGR